MPKASLTPSHRPPPDSARAVGIVGRSGNSAGGTAGFSALVGNRAAMLGLGAALVQPKLRIGSPGDVFEQEADRVAQAVACRSPSGIAKGRSLQTPPPGSVPRKCAKCEQEEGETLRRSLKDGGDAPAAEATTGSSPAAPVAETAPETPATEQSPTPSEETPSEPSTEAKGGATLLVDDDAGQIGPGQMRKSEFLTALRESVGETANEAMAPTGQTTENCPWMEYWFSQAADKDAAYIEKALRKYAPETAAASTAQEFIPLVAARVRRSVEQWAKTGEIMGLPEGVTPDIPGLGVLGGLTAGLGGMFFKAKAGGPRAVSDTQAIRHQLGTGRPLPGGVRSRMESAFGLSFSQVRIHTDSGAASLSDQLNARAFTVGEHVAFGPREYQPGTLAGDALLAHELAHVVQQGGPTKASSPMLKGEGEYSSLEQDADRSAVGAVASMWSGTKTAMGSISRQSTPSLRSGLGLQRCAGSGAKATKTPACSAPAAKEWAASVAAEEAITEPDRKRDATLALVQQALCPLGVDVRLAGSKHSGEVDPEDYQPLPVVNFDVGLNGKQSWPAAGEACKRTPPPKRGCETRLLERNYGYNFRSGSTVYVVLGPYAISNGTPAFTQRAAEHELTLARTLTAGRTAGSRNDPELDTWVQDFRKYFHFLGFKEGTRYSGAGWEPLLDIYYEGDNTSDEARRRAVDQLVDYFQNAPRTDAAAGSPGHPTDPDAVRELFRLWMKKMERQRASRQLIQDLKARIPAP
jgi:Domain of unknown function (DUF4157)